MIGHAEKIWLLLIGLTLAGAWLGETGEAGWPLSLVVVVLIAVKGGMVIDHYMEMRMANKRIRQVLFLFVTMVVLLVIVGHGWGEWIKGITSIY